MPPSCLAGGLAAAAAVAVIFVGARFLLAPGASAAAFGLPG